MKSAATSSKPPTSSKRVAISVDADKSSSDLSEIEDVDEVQCAAAVHAD